jgi:uncharacterized membrane protein HdeD (DUF308 family)
VKRSKGYEIAMSAGRAAAILLAICVGLVALMYFTGFGLVPPVFVGVAALTGGALTVAGAINAAWYPDSAWRAADQNKIVWVALQLGGLAVFGVPGFVAAIAYFALVRPKLRSGINISA